MTDSLDKAILWSLIEGPKSTWEIAKRIQEKGKIKADDYQTRKFCNRIRYRVSAMKEEGFIVHDTKNGKYALENVIVGTMTGKITPDDKEDKEETIEMGKTIMANLDTGIKLFFLEESE